MKKIIFISILFLGTLINGFSQPHDFEIPPEGGGAGGGGGTNYNPTSNYTFSSVYGTIVSVHFSIRQTEDGFETFNVSIDDTDPTSDWVGVSHSLISSISVYYPSSNEIRLTLLCKITVTYFDGTFEIIGTDTLYQNRTISVNL